MSFKRGDEIVRRLILELDAPVISALFCTARVRLSLNADHDSIDTCPWTPFAQAKLEAAERRKAAASRASAHVEPAMPAAPSIASQEAVLTPEPTASPMLPSSSDQAATLTPTASDEGSSLVEKEVVPGEGLAVEADCRERQQVADSKTDERQVEPGSGTETLIREPGSCPESHVAGGAAGATQSGHERTLETVDETTTTAESRESSATASVAPVPSGPTQSSSGGVNGPVGMRPKVQLRALTMADMRKAKDQVSGYELCQRRRHSDHLFDQLSEQSFVRLWSLGSLVSAMKQATTLQIPLLEPSFIQHLWDDDSCCLLLILRVSIRTTGGGHHYGLLI